MKNIKKTKTFFLLVTTLLFSTLKIVTAETLLNKNFNSFQLKIDNESDSILLAINGKDKKPKILDLFELQNPNRIVLDAINITAPSNASYVITKNSEIKKIRIGKHSNKVRFVIDIKDENIPKFQILNSTGNNLIVKLNKNNLTRKNNTIVKQNNTPKIKQATNTLRKVNQTEKQKIIPQAINQKKESSSQNIKKSLNNTRNKVGENKQSIEEVSGDQGLEDIKFYFKKDKKTPLVRFMFVKKPKYTIKKKSEKKYILTVKNARIRWPHLELPQFPPRDFRGFTMIMPSIKNGNLNIVIGVERGSKIISYTKENEVWLKVENYS